MPRIPTTGSRPDPAPEPASVPGPRGDGPEPSAVHSLEVSRPMIIDRDPSFDIVLTDLLVSRRHAEVSSVADGTIVRDLGSGNGTFVNGYRAAGQVLRPGDLITIGPHVLQFDGMRLVEHLDVADVAFGASAISVVVHGGRTLVDDVSFSVPPRTLMAVVGPSGAGKSTLLGALTGLRPAESGQVWYAGRDLYANYEELRQRIGFVPQQDILHHPLSLPLALGYAAELRFPRETTAADRQVRIEEVVAQLGLHGPYSEGTAVGRCSGGERKRASTAMELLTKPSVLFLDEPTSGLDPHLAREVMSRLRMLADEGRTVILVTHDVEFISSCDLVLVLAPGGHMAFLGPPGDAAAYFGKGSWADI